MNVRLASHATIALLASSCALDFSWPLDLVTTCETDAHCPEGLVCRFNSCGRDAVGKEGELCSLDGRCEEGLLCDEIVCRKSRNNEPVPVWDVALGNGLSMLDLGLVTQPDGKTFVAGGVQGKLTIDGEVVPSTDPPESLSYLFASLDGPSVLRSAVSPVTSFNVFLDILSAELLHVAPEGLLVAFGHQTYDSASARIRQSVQLRRIDLAATTAADVREFSRDDASVRIEASAATPFGGWLALEIRPDVPDPATDPVSHLVLALGPTGGTSEVWVLPDSTREGLSATGDVAPIGATSAVVTRTSAIRDLVPGESSRSTAHELLRLDLLAEPTRLFVVAGVVSMARSVATSAGGDIALCAVAIESPRVWSAAGTLLATLPEPEGASDIAVVLRTPDGNVRGSLVPLEGLQGTPSCVYLADATLAVAGWTTGQAPELPGRPLSAEDRDLLVLGLDPTTLAVRWTIRHGDRGTQSGKRIVATDDGFVIAGTFSSGLNLGHGTRRALSGSDLFIARYRLPAP